ncbi:unnamed protein product [Ceutorhynchus assimilis]|uniref:Claspin n=1 Tax=Ceutorhynchus assimilis TaxID=467358 RepID=A0A9N9MGS6_9CUCU|nr:unnamed protein product [Ceutorhynchus assimilis]
MFVLFYFCVPNYLFPLCYSAFKLIYLIYQKKMELNNDKITINDEISNSETQAPKKSDFDTSKSSTSESFIPDQNAVCNSFDTTLTISNRSAKQDLSSAIQQSNEEKVSNCIPTALLDDSDIEDEINNRKQEQGKAKKHIASLLSSDIEESEIEAINEESNTNHEITSFSADLDPKILIIAENNDTKESNNENLIQPPKTHKRITIFDSDSDSDHLEHSNDKNNDKEKSHDENSTPISKNHKRATIFDSDSDSNDMEHDKDLINDENPKEPSKNHKRVTIFDSDSDSDHMDNNKSPTNAVVTTPGLILETLQKSRLAMLCDSDSEEEPENHNSSNEIIEQTQPEIKPKAQKKSKPTKSKFKELGEVAKVTNTIEAAKQRTEIQSESQRMLRERNMSLPYHKPKAHSLKDFLARRPKLGQPLANRAPPSVAIKMTTEQLEVISKQMQEREKQLKEFYKSESESDGELNGSDGEYVPPTDEEEKIESSESPKNSSNLVLIDGIPVNSSSSESTNVSSNLVLINGAPVNASSSGSTNDETPVNASSSGSTKASSNLVVINGSPAIASSTDDSEEVVATKNNKTSSSDDIEKLENSSELILDNETPAPLSEEFKKTPEENSQDEISTETVSIHTQEIAESIQIDETPLINNSTGVVEETPIPTDTEKAVTEKQPLVPEPDSEIIDETQNAKFIYTDLDREIENYGNIEKEPPVETYKSKLQLLKEKLANDRPRLSGGPNEVIDLDLNVSKPQEVVQLMERFAKHAAAKRQHHHKVKLNIVRVETGGDIHQEELSMNVHSDEEDVMEEKPGVKFKKLKQELQKQMEQKKAEIWQQKASKGIRGGLENADEEEETEKDILDFDEEEEAIMTDEEEEEDDELIEDDIDLTDKPTKKSAFLDEEAEEDEASVKEGYEDNIEDEENENDEDNDDDDDTPSEIEEPKKPLKRIIKPADDSDDDDLFNESIAPKSPSQLDATITADEDEIPPHQPQRQFQTPMRPDPSQAKSIADFLTPISFITSIQNLNSAPKNTTPFRMPSDLQTPDKEQKMCQKKLFGFDSLESQTEESFAELMEEPTVSIEDSPDIPPSTQEMASVCSGAFSGLQMESTQFVAQSSSDLTSLGEENNIISQLLDEEEFEIDSSSAVDVSQIVETELLSGGRIIDSDEEGEELQQIKKKNCKPLQFSDDESSEEEVEEEEEEIDLQDNEGLDEDIAYDSEENEIDLNDRPEKIKIADFVDAEAELSESEWGSEDEDEKGLDKLEFELGDTEKFDDEKVKSDLEKIHMRRMLDDDTREVKLLQELLLEDGEMHGTGRQRQFKWRNVDLTDDQDEGKKDDDDVYLDDEVSEEQWRKNRHEREMLLQKLQEKSQSLIEDDSSGSQLLELGRKFLEKSEDSQNNTPNEKEKPSSPFKLTPFNLQSKRGSFLNRSDQVLKRVAEYTKIAIASDSKKTTKHFLFQSTSAIESSIEQNKKRKANEGTPNVLKKLRLSTNFSPAMKKKMDKSERSRKLFNF